MVACMCKGVSDGELRRALAAGAGLEEVLRATGAGSDCGCCADVLRRIAVEAARPSPAPAPPGRAAGAAGGCRPGFPPCPGCDRVAHATARALSAA